MNPRLKKTLLLVLAAAMLIGAGGIERSLNHDRDALGLTRGAVLQNAPPALAFTTVALGGFRGLISNFLWIRAQQLQEDDKFFEAAQLADWITKLEPTYTQVWLFQAWNMAYNISVKFKENAPGDYTDRWHWLERGIELLRDDGLRYNPNSILIYRELGWFFQHKMGQNLDDANIYYKSQWANEMKGFFGPQGTNFDRLLHPQTADDFKQLEVLTNQYKLDPAFARAVDERYGPFDWRLPEAHAIYWGAKGLDEAAKHPSQVKADDLITVRRIIYQSLLQAFHHGRVIANPYNNSYSLGPNLDLVAHLNEAYTNFYAEESDPSQKDGILKAHRNFLRDAIYFLYVADRMGEAQKWFNYLGEKYPDKAIIENQPDSLPKTLTLDQYAVAVIQIDIGETSQERVESAVEGLLRTAYISLAGGEEDRYLNLRNLAQNVHAKYMKATSVANGNVRLKLMPFEYYRSIVARELVGPDSELPYEARAILRTRLGLPAETAPTNAPPPAETAPAVNAPATNAVSPSQP